MSVQPEADALVLFGATGDLSRRKLFLSLYNLERHGTLHVPVIGVARSDWSDEGFRQHAHDAILAARPDAMAAWSCATLASSRTEAQTVVRGPTLLSRR